MNTPAFPQRAQAQLLAMCALVLLVSCGGSLLPKPPPAPARHTLDAGAGLQPTVTPPPSSLAPVLILAQPTAAPGYESRRMVYQQDALELQAFAFHEWVEPPARLLAPLLVRALQDGGGFRAVLMAPSAVAGGWLLETELTRLQQNFATQPSRVQLSLRAVLLDGSTRQVIAWRSFDTQVPAMHDDPVAGVQAAQRAAQGLLLDVAAFCKAEVQRAAANARGAGGSVP